MAVSITRINLESVISAAIHSGCECSLEQCGAGEFHDREAEDVADALVHENLVEIAGS